MAVRLKNESITQNNFTRHGNYTTCSIDCSFLIPENTNGYTANDDFCDQETMEPNCDEEAEEAKRLENLEL